MRTYTLQFSPEQLDYVFRSLAVRPWGEVKDLMAAIQSQAAEQNTPQELRPAQTAASE